MTGKRMDTEEAKGGRVGREFKTRDTADWQDAELDEDRKTLGQRT